MSVACELGSTVESAQEIVPSSAVEHEPWLVWIEETEIHEGNAAIETFVALKPIRPGALATIVTLSASPTEAVAFAAAAVSVSGSGGSDVETGGRGL